MKKAILLGSMLMPIGAIMAQPTITSGQYITVSIDTISQVKAGSIGPGPAGANVTWDFSQLPIVQSRNAVQEGDCPGNAICSQFPNATSYSKNTTLVVAPVTLYSVSRKTAQKVEMLGGQDDGQSVYTYDNPRTILEFPVMYGQTFSDTYAVNATGNSGVLSDTIDGYGTIITPLGTFTNVLRQKEVERDTSIYGGTTLVAEMTTYTWLKADQPGLILFYLEGTLLVPEVKPIKPIIFYGNNPPYTITDVPGIRVSQPSVDVYPNPVTGNSFRIRSEQHTLSSIRLTDIAGRTVREERINGGRLDHVVNTEAYPPGIYLLSVVTEKGTTVKKVAIH